MQEGERNAATAGAEVEDPQRFSGGKERSETERPLFGLWAGYECWRADGKEEGSEGLVA